MPVSITLRKANALQNSINDAVRKIELDPQVTITEFESPAKVIGEREAVVFKNLARTQSLIQALYEIRSAVSDANYTAGISADLTEIARLDREAAVLDSLAESAVKLADAVIIGQLDKIKNTANDHRAAIYGRDVVNTSVLSKEQVAEFRAQAQQNKRSKQKLQDAVLEKNVRTDIVLSDQAVNVLQQEGLL